MTFSTYINPYVSRRIGRYKVYCRKKQYEKAFTELENAHVLGQASTFHHALVHGLMLIHGIKTRHWNEVAGQILRILGALTKTPMGLLPKGNTGGSNVSPFKPMPLTNTHQRILSGFRSN